jgi:hypothetical protein
MGEMLNAYKIMVGKPNGGKDHSQDLGVDGRVLLQWFLGK